ncbi:hypothetical protein [Escherichia coli]|uniref:hypothetical protein n=1 Tax=Escherichia coli TaxID=562 RepID=UPI0030C65F24
MSELTAAHSTIEKAREVTNCPDGVDLQDHLKQLVAESVALNNFIKTSCYVYDGDGSDVSDAYTPAHESPMMPKQPHSMTPVFAECTALRAAFINYLVTENLSNKPDADEAKVYAHCAKWVDAMCETPATDSILRAAEARGVDAFTAKLRKDLEELDPEIFAYGEVKNALNMAITSSEMFSRQLCEGKAE